MFLQLLLNKCVIIIKTVLNIVLKQFFDEFNINNTHNFNSDSLIPKSVNYHFTRKCNYECGFCFHTAKTSYMINLDDAKLGLKLLKLAGE